MLIKHLPSKIWSFFCLTGNVANSFAIDPILGTITVAKELDRSSKTAFELTVKATDGGIPPLSTTTTNAMLVYQIVEPFAHNYFAIDASTGVIRTTTALDYEQRSVFHFTVQVHDLGMPRLFAETAANVTIEVVDVNDCSPVFSQELYETTVIVPTYKGVEVIQVNATDSDSGPNSKLLFSVSEGNIGDKFKMDPITGIISIQNVTQLRSRYELKVRVSDGRFAAVATVKINVKENKGTIIAAVGNQVNEPLFYKILNPDSRFEISRTSGVVSTTGISFDREAQDTYDIVVEVTREDKSEDGAHVLVTLTVEDVNDNKPVFVNLPYHALVQMDAEEGQVIRQVKALDKDTGPNADIHYYLKEHQEHFELSPSGEISLRKKFEKDSLNTDFVVVVVAKDNGELALSAEVEVPITVVNKATPVFEKPFYSIEIPENIQLHSPVLHVQANDSEGPRIVYTISEGDPFKQFSIDFNTGVIHVVQPLDFETHPAYKLNIRATDSLTGAHSEVFVDIILEDVNDNAPVFLSKTYYANISEASVIGTSVLQVDAKDSDTGHNQEVFFMLVEERGKSSNYFSIDRDTGIISTAQVLDHEEIQQHKLKVRVVDGGVPALSSDVIVTIDVTDLNDNAPVFTEHTYKTTISELAPREHFVSQVQASDADSSDANKLEFSIISGNEDQNFAINKHTGAIIISNHRRPHMQPVYNLNVSVSDGVFRGSALVVVTVIGANFHNPTFSQVEYLVELVENSPAGTLVTCRVYKKKKKAL
uniref:Cadherin domain-containing protein n=1 Tax=Acanthochromis polyacanthus TaxID=80966 RepID=A0A3Q1HDZ9_9TELE